MFCSSSKKRSNEPRHPSIDAHLKRHLHAAVESVEILMDPPFAAVQSTKNVRSSVSNRCPVLWSFIQRRYP